MYTHTHTHLGLLHLLHGDQAARGVAGERLLTVADEPQTRMPRNHLLAVPEWSKQKSEGRQ